MAGRGRPPSAKTLVDRQLGRNTGIVIPAGDPYIIPNHSGDHDAGRILKTPTEDTNIANKKYVDDEIDGKIADGTAQGQMSFWDATLNKWVVTKTSERFWDDVNKRSGFGTNTPGYDLEVDGDGKFSGGLYSFGTSSPTANKTVSIGASAHDHALHVTKGLSTTGASAQYATRLATSANISETSIQQLRSLNLEFYKYGVGQLSGDVFGGKIYLSNQSASTCSKIKGFAIGIQATDASSIITNATNLIIEDRSGGAGTITNNYGVEVGNLSYGTNSRGLYLKNQATAGATHYAIYSEGGKSYHEGDVGIGSTSPQGKLHVGDQATNYMKVASDGQIGLVGTARVKDCVWIDAASIRAPLTKSATYVAHGLNGAWSFADAVEANQETINAATKIPSNIDRSVAPSFKIAWSADGVSPGNCKWQFEYVWRALNEDTTAVAQETLTVVSTASATSNGLVVAEITGIDLPSSSDECLYFRITRLSADAQDTIADTTELLCICLEFTADKLGTAL